MTSLPNVPAKAVGDFTLAADWNNYVDNGFAWEDSGRPVIHITQASGSTQTLTTGVFTAITFTNETIDRRGQHSTSSNTSRVLATADLGTYAVFGQVAFAGDTTGDRRAKVITNGTTDLLGNWGIYPSGATFGTASCFGIWVPAASTDYIELYGFQSSGGNLATAASGAFTSSLMLWRLGS